jgi:hypothetical protein
MTPTTTNNNSKQWTTYINTGLLTLIGSVLVSVWTNVNEIKKDMGKITTEVSRIKLQQDINTGAIGSLEDKIYEIESNYILDMMDWTSQNFVRKQQK